MKHPLTSRRAAWATVMVGLYGLIGCGTTEGPPAAATPPGGGGGNVPIEVQSPSPSATPLPSPSPTWHPFVPPPSPTPSPTPSLPPAGHVYGTSGSFDTDFSADAVGSVPPEFVNVQDDGFSYPWLYAGNWSVIASGSLHMYGIDEIRPQPALSFRRYRGTAFGTSNGELPLHYRASVVEQAFASDPNEYPPTGDQGVQVFYLDPTHYVEVLFKPHDLQVWECNGGVPNGYGGWKQLFEQQTDTAAGQIRTMGADVDCNSGQLVFYVDGQELATLHSSLISPRTHWFALRATGNEVYFQRVDIQSE